MLLDLIEELFKDEPWLPALLWVIFVVALLCGLVWAVRKMWPVLRKVVALGDALGDLPDWMATTDATLKEQNTSLAQIKHEVLPNNGGSLRDAVDRHTTAIGQINDKLSNDNTRIIQLQARDELGRFKKEES